MNAAKSETTERCAFATPTDERWCNCRVACRVVVCANRLRNDILRTRSDGASRHSYDATGYNALFRTGLNREPIPFPEGAIFVRSAFCGRGHCVDFAPKEADDGARRDFPPLLPFAPPPETERR